MMIWSLAMKDLRVLFRDRRSIFILLAMPLVFIVVLGISLGEGFGQKPDDRLRVSLVDLDQGLSDETRKATANGGTSFPPTTWSKLVQEDMAASAGIRIEVIGSREEAEQLVRSSQRAAVLVFGPEYSEKFHQCSFLATGINPFHRDGIDLDRINAEFIIDPTQLAAASIIEQVAQGTTMRVMIPWMIGRAFERVGSALGPFVKRGIAQQFPNYDLTAKTWAALCKEPERQIGDPGVTFFSGTSNGGVLNRGSYRYQVLVPSYTVMFSFFLVLTCGWLFAAERREGTLKRLRAAPVSRAQIIAGKLIPCFLLSNIQGLFLFTAGYVLFGMSWGEHPQYLLLVIVATAIATTGMALLLATLAKTETQVMIFGSMIVLAMAGISGCLMPRELMPDQMKQISRITPHAWALDAYTQLLLNPDPNLAMVLTACAALTGFGVGFLLLAILLLRLD